ncbi:alpha/beta hydrolase [Nocardia sp. NPDC051030]|uniref:alpha/beta fold hydrolase n=1 Tax=Nocardia sp. NPDC051030 TaxID=3155162 RepID=UPI00343C38B8
MNPVTTHTLEAPGARLHYELRGSGPLIALVGAPMAAPAFAPLAELLASDHTVLTTDPRGHYNSTLEDPEQDSTPEIRADDLARLITHLDAGPAVVLGSSGGAITVLAFAQAHPELVTAVIAHEPPVTELLDDRSALHAGNEDIIATHLGGDQLGAWRKFLAQADIAMPEPVIEMVFGNDRDPRQLASESYWFAHELRGTALFRPDIEKLRSVRIVVGIGEGSTGQICDRTSRALATALEVDPVLFPGDHTGFVSEPVAFEERLRKVLQTL